MAGQFSNELEIAVTLARQAGEAILETSVDRSALQISEKTREDGLPATPVTNADFLANRIISKGLKTAFPNYALLSEETDEGVLDAAWHEAMHAWIIDPLDGTEEFIRGGKDFGIHIGLTIEGEPALGVNYYPATDVLYWAMKGQGAWKQNGKGEKKRLLPQCSDGEGVFLPLSSKSDLVANDILKKLLDSKCASVGYVGSTGLRLCAIAEGSYNVYLASAKRAGLWDFLSGEVILREVGCLISDWEGIPVDYRRKDTRLPRGVVVCRNRQIYDSMIAQLKDQSLIEVSQ